MTNTRMVCSLTLGWILLLSACQEKDPLAEEASALLSAFAGALAERNASAVFDSVDHASRVEFASIADANKQLRARVDALSDEKDKDAARAWLSNARVPEAGDALALLGGALSGREEVTLASAARAGLRSTLIEETPDGVLRVTTEGGSAWTLVREEAGLRVRLEECELRSLRMAKERLKHLGERLDVWILERQRLRAGWSQ